MHKDCYKCEERYIGCHGNCTKYKKNKEELEKKKAYLEIDKIFGDYVYHAVKRMKGVRV